MNALYSNDEKREVIEFMIEQWRPARSGETGERAMYLILKAIAADYRARDHIRIGAVIQKLERALDYAEAKKQPILGYQQGNLREIAELTIGSWPVIRQALEEWERLNA